ncbi:MAG: site-2 protease family protein [Pirellulaceae bacterium]|nr:site-2 protease family protein [Pirellulaceae bacterium]
MGSTLLIDSLNFFAWDLLPLAASEPSRLSDLMATIWGVFQVALGLGFVIFVHELGHFLAAKTFGVRCDKFYVGFDVPISIGPIKLPSNLGKFQWGETEYGIGIIPLGGYVKMLGQDDDPRKAEAEAERSRLGEGADAPLDPRSYPAKPVWQRMIIISAGVVMNLIFAVIMAGVAYRYGVPYMPTVIGDVVGGGPAWQAGVLPGDRLLQVGNMSHENPNLRFDDFRMEVALRGKDGRGTAIPLVIERGSEKLEVSPLPTNLYDPVSGIYALGVISPSSTNYAMKAFPKGSYLEKAKPDLQSGDKILAVDGVPLPDDPRFNQPLGSELNALLQAKWDKPVRLSIERPGEKKDDPAKKLEIEVPAIPVKTFGLDFAPGAITAIRKGSTAEAAGVKVGDKIVAVDGQAVTQGLRLPSLIASKAGNSIELKVLRKAPSENKPDAQADTAVESSEMTFQLATSSQPQFDNIAMFGGVQTLADLGIAYEVSNVVSSVDSAIITDGSIQVGDTLAQIRWEPSEEGKEALQELYSAKGMRIILADQLIDQSLTVASMFDQLQDAPIDMNLRCYLKRDGKTVEVVTKLQYATDWFWFQRGLGLKPLSDIHSVNSVAEAVSLGAFETWRRFKEVLSVLRLLATGKLGAGSLGGPIKIFQAAGQEASQGVSRLLLFLTFLSANLAILNFLPIPALDGGHMVFLTAEAIRGKPVNEELQVRLTVVGMMCLLCLMAFVIVKDVVDLIP